MDPNTQQYYGYAAPGGYNQNPNAAKVKKIIIFSLGGFLGLIALIAAYLFFFTTPSLRSDMVELTSMHIEMGRIAQLGVDSERARRDTKNIAATIKMVSLNNQIKLSAYIADNYGNGLTKAERAASQNANIDGLLEEAGQLNNYDTKFNEVATELLSQMNNEVSSIYEQTSSDELKALLTEVGTNNQVLIEGLAN